MVCPKCGAPVNNGEEYCSKCGYPIPKEEKRKRSVFVFALIIVAEIMIIGIAAFFLFSIMKEKAKDTVEDNTTVTAESQKEENNNGDSAKLEDISAENDSETEAEAEPETDKNAEAEESAEAEPKADKNAETEESAEAEPETDKNAEAEPVKEDNAESVDPGMNAESAIALEQTKETFAAVVQPAEENMAEPAPEGEEAASPVQVMAADADMILATDEETVSRVRSTYTYLSTNRITAQASSTIKQTEVQNPPINIFDDDRMSNWQEGIKESSGIGEWVTAVFDKTYAVNALTLRLGNWKTDRYFYGNNRPKTLKFEAGGREWTQTFPDEWKEFTLLFTAPVEISEMTITLEDVYRGAEWDDTVITDICVWYN